MNPWYLRAPDIFWAFMPPEKKDLEPFLAAVHHAALCQAEGGRIVKSLQERCHWSELLFPIHMLNHGGIMKKTGGRNKNRCPAESFIY